MKIVEDSSNRLVLKQGAIMSRIVGGVIASAGVIVVGVGVTSAHGIVLYAIGAVCIVVGALVLILSKSDLVVADKASRQLTVTFKSLTNRNGQTSQCSFDDVQSVQLLQQYRQEYVNNGSNMNNGTGISFGTNGVGVGNGSSQTMLDLNLTVMLKNGTTISIAKETHQVTMGLGVSSNNLQTKGQKLADALGAGFQVVGAATPGQMVQAVENKIANAAQPTTQSNPVPSVSPQPPATPPQTPSAT